LRTKLSLQTPNGEVAPGPTLGGFFGEVALSLYGAAGRVALPAAGAMFAWRAKRGKEDISRRSERFGVSRLERPAGPLIWLHAASVGETMAAAPLIARLHERGPSLLLTTGTVTAAEVAGRQLNGSVIHQFAPIDSPPTARRFLDTWKPDLALFAESELWPTMLNAMGRRALPLVVISARMSERSFRMWRTFPPLARAVMGRAELFLAQSTDDAERLSALGARHVSVSGNLKFDVPPPPADEAVLAVLRVEIGARPVLLAASTHGGEEAVVIAAHKKLAQGGGRLLTILAPRHPKRGDAVAEELRASGLRFARRSLGEPIGEDTDIYLADTIGEMGLWYRLADVAFLGGSIAPRGGQNPIEPAKLMVPVVHGAHVRNFRDVYAALTEAKAVQPVSDGDSLAATVRRLLENEAERLRQAREARACVERFTGALDRTMDALEPYLSALGYDEAADHEAATRA
jgi:3-deoxy-D-manno-octulosonic-acid transferase